MTIVERTTQIAAPVADVFAYVDDFGNAAEWFYGLTRIEPVNDIRSAVGACYDGTMKLGVSLTSRLECTAWERDRLIELTSVKGIKNVQRWEFKALDEGRCEVSGRIDFQLPGGPVGKTMGKVVSPLIGVAVQSTADALVSRFSA